MSFTMKTGQIVTHRGMETLYGLRRLFGTQVPVGWDKVRVGFKFVGGVVGTGDGMEPRQEPTSCGATSVSQLKINGSPSVSIKSHPDPALAFFLDTKCHLSSSSITSTWTGAC